MARTALVQLAALCFVACFATLLPQSDAAASSHPLPAAGADVAVTYRRNLAIVPTCSPGSYYDSNDDACYTCPAGFGCDGSDAQVECGVGFYALTGSYNCTACPAGSQCATTTDAPVACAQGQYSPEGDPICRGCDAGYYCAAPHLDMLACPDGSWSSTNATSCTICAAGYQCSTTAATPCGVNTYSFEGSVSCSQCPNGYYCPSATEPPRLCPSGTYLIHDGSGSNCTTCEAGYYCPTTSSAPLPCDPGLYSAAGAVACTLCPAGSNCSGTTANNVGACPAGSYSVAGSSECTECEAGYQCSRTASAPCAPGTYSLGGATSCTDCPAGSYCESRDSPPVTCATGYYSLGNALECTPCPAGFSCPSQSSAELVECEPGWYSISGVDTCTECPAGSYCRFTYDDDVQDCPSGFFSNAGQDVCHPCRGGFACTSDQDGEALCGAGTYSPPMHPTCDTCPTDRICPRSGMASPEECSNVGDYAVNSTHCIPCPSGYYCPTPDRSQITLCPEHYYSDASALACTLCEPGYLCTGTGNMNAQGTDVAGSGTGGIGELCPIGSWCNPADSETYCPAGMYGTKDGASSLDDGCAPCPPGYMCEIGAYFDEVGGDNAISECELGHYCPLGSHALTAVPCRSGTYISQAMDAVDGGDGVHFNDHENDCEPCPATFYCDEQADGSGRDTDTYYTCPTGYYCPTGTQYAFQYPCPAGKYNDLTGQDDEYDCKVCEPGYYCPQAASYMIACEPGTYNPFSSGVSIQSCFECLPGYACPLAAMTNSTHYPCEDGHYCPPGTVWTKDYPCPAGKYTLLTNLSREEDCEICPPGQACPLGCGIDEPLQDCSVGHFCPAGTKYPAQYDCPPGTYTDQTNLTASGECSTCPPGYYCEGGGITPLDTDLEDFIADMCAPGYYCPAHSESMYEVPCPAGTYNNFSAMFHLDNCSACPVGHYCPEGTADPIACFAGSYANVTGTQGPGILGSNAARYTVDESISNCNICPQGYECPTGTDQPIACAAGEYSDLGYDACLPCQAGHYCVGATGIDDMVNNAKCPAGLYCAEGTEVEPTPSARFNCTIGHYCPEETVLPVECPVGYYMNETGAEVCTICDSGYYCIEGQIAINDTVKCDEGYFCPEGSSGPQQEPCPGGFWTGIRGTTGVDSGDNSCASCTEGFYCPPGSASELDCPAGSYCPAESSEPLPCPAGKFGDSENLASSSDCTTCTDGYYCEAEGLLDVSGPCDAGFYCNSTERDNIVPNPPLSICPVGHHCEQGSTTPARCAEGTFADVEGLEQCNLCPAGYYCTTLGVVDECPINHRCPFGTKVPIACEAGDYTQHTGATECEACPEGYYCEADENGTAVFVCPQGHYCPALSIEPQPCPGGTYLGAEAMTQPSDCLPCTPGWYCDESGLTAPKGLCSAGFYCSNGSTTAEPSLQSFGDQCPPGAYCPEGSVEPLPCPAGTYNNRSQQTSLSDCLVCPAGFYCVESSSSYSGSECDPGYYCPAGTQSAMENACPEGTYTGADGTGELLTMRTNASACLDCPPGEYCAGLGNGAPDGLCDAGYYCSGNATVAAPTDGVTGAKCLDGELCAAGSSRPEKCPARYYCEDGANVTGFCNEGYYCAGASSTASPGGELDSTGSVVGDVCPAGHFCPQGSAAPTVCPPGSFNNATGKGACEECPATKFCNDSSTLTPLDCPEEYYCPPNTSTFELFPCTPGSYCPALAASPVPCSAGTYQDQYQKSSCKTCPAGSYCPSNSSNPLPCTIGHYCPINSSTPVQCEDGTRSNVGGNSECEACPAGYYCDASQGLSSMINGTLCPAGQYCPNGTALVTQIPCPVGSFSTSLGLQREDQCTPCTPGSYCSETGATVVTGPCAAGYYCVGGAEVPTPNGTAVCSGNFTGAKCPPGFFCPEGSTGGEPCPQGTFSSASQAESNATCNSCTAGFFCPNTSMTEPLDVCPEGYYCPGGQRIGEEYACPPGKFCPLGSDDPIECAPGFHQNETAQANCSACPAGMYCDASSETARVDGLPCPEGYYCPVGTASYAQFPCPPATFSNTTRLVNISQCTPCSPGSYCASEHLTAPTGLCAEGYFCRNGSNTATPGLENPFLSCADSCPDSELAGSVCPVGHFCPEGSSSPQPCPRGSFGNSTMLSRSSQCHSCTPGYFCPNVGMVEPVDACVSGYYCPGGQLNGTEVPCPVGNYCPEGSSAPLPCEAGLRQLNEGQDQCEPCPVGMFCSGNVSNLVARTTGEICPAGSFCPIQTSTSTEHLCREGTFSTREGLTNWTECDICPPGSYCGSEGLTAVSGPCSEGYYCIGGASVSTPSDSIPFGFCGSPVCGSYDSPAGADTVTGDVCPPGFFCPEGSETPTGCPQDTFSNAEGLWAEHQCLNCTAGYVCDGGNLTAPSGPCPAGFYCPGGAKVPCTAGAFCEGSNVAPVDCALGTMQPEVGQSACIECVAGRYCDGSRDFVNGTACPPGNYCPSGSAEPEPCPAGTFNDRAQQTNQSSACLECPERYYCERESTNFTETPCPAGRYCPNGTAHPDDFLCPEGTFSSAGSLAREDECTPCSLGYACPSRGLTEPEVACYAGYYCSPAGRQDPNEETQQCDAGYVCLGGSPTPRPTLETGGGYICPAGHFCVPGTTTAEACPPGTYSTQEGGANISTCLTCPAGRICADAGMNHTDPCPEGYFCEEGSSIGTLCPNGKYGHETGLSRRTQCATCPGGSYCTGGRVSGQCEAGYVCYQGADESTFEFPCGEIYNEEQSQALYNCTGEPCPQGYYCPAGSAHPLACPAGSYREDVRGDHWKNCTACTPGFYCLEGTRDPLECPAGSYCPLNSSVPLACPAGTYSDTPGLESTNECTQCPDGYDCTGTNLTTYEDYPCQLGSFCVAGAVYGCPGGTYGPNVGAASVDDCVTCPAGNYCPYGNSSVGTIVPIPCGSGYQCYEGEIEPQLCPAGFYCSEETMNVCPAGYYCPIGTAYPIACEKPGTYCPERSFQELVCLNGTIVEPKQISADAGLEFNLSSLVSSSQNNSCRDCPPGTYQPYWDVNRTTCDPCHAGYICTGRTTNPQPLIRYAESWYGTELEQDFFLPSRDDPTWNGYICPRGFYCKEAAVVEVACPAGTYQPDLGAHNESDCLECPAGQYSTFSGSSACFDCPASSVSDAGSTTCKCSGSNRVYQPSDQSCVCAPEYVVASGNETLSDVDGVSACQPRVLNVCDSNLRTHTGECCDDKFACCEDECASGGRLNAVSGQCVCNGGPKNLEEVLKGNGCGDNCQSEQLTLHYDCDTNEMFSRDSDGDVLYFSRDEESEDALEGAFYYDEDNIDLPCCKSDAGCSILAVKMANGSANGVVGYSPEFDHMTSRRGRNLQEGRRRRLQELSDYQVEVGTPVMCIVAGESILFDIDPDTNSFPEYHKNSLLNSNPEFDYGAFRRLAELAANTSLFVFPFPDGGVYVFWDGSNSDSQSIVVVQPVGSQCPGGSSSIYPLSTTTLTSLGLGLQDDNVTLSADWTGIIIALAALFTLIFIILVTTCVVQRRQWKTAAAKEPFFRTDAQHVALQAYHSKGSFLRQVMPASDREVFNDAEAQRRKAKKDGDEAWKLDELSVQELLERLQYHHNTVKRSFEKDESDVRGIIDNIRDEADTLKKMLATASITDMDANEELLEFINKMEHELTARSVFDTRLSTAEEDLAAALNDLYDHLGTEGPKPPSQKIADEMAQSDAPDNYSDTLDILLDLVQSTYRFSRATVRVIDAEEQRRNQAKLRNPRDKELLASMNALRSTERNTWESIDALGKGLSIYAASIANSPDALANVEEDMKQELAAGVPASRIREVTALFTKKFLYPTETVHSAIHALLDIYSDVQADLGELRDAEMERRDQLSELLAAKRRKLEDAMKKAGKDVDKDGPKEMFDGDIDKFVEAQQAQDQDELQQLLQLHGDRALLEESARLTAAKAQLVKDATAAALSDADARQLLNSFQMDQKSMNLDLVAEQKMAKAKALRRFERMKEERKNKNSRKAMKERASALKEKHDSDINQLKDEFSSQALEKLESTKLEFLQVAEAQQREVEAKATKFGQEQGERLKLRVEKELAKLESPDHVLGKTLKAEEENQIRRVDERVKLAFGEFSSHVQEATKALVELVESDADISDEEKRHLLEDIRAEEGLELARLEKESTRIRNEEKAKLAQLVKDLSADTSMSLQDKLKEMHGQEMEGIRLFGQEAEAQLRTLLENEKNQGVLTSQSMLKARERSLKTSLDSELEALIKAKEADFEKEEADLLAALGDDDDDWWEDTLTRAVVTEHENDNSEWDILQEDHKKKTVAQKQKQDQELKSLDEDFSSEEQQILEELSREFADKLSMHERKLAEIREELGPNVSDAQFRAVLEERGLQPLDEFKKALKEEKALKKMHMLQRLEERRDQKARHLKSTHDAQLKSAEQDFLKEKLALKVMKARKAEVRVLKATLEQGIVAPSEIGLAIEKAFEMRHGAEFMSLLVQQSEEQSSALKKELTSLFDRKNRERVQLLEQLKQNGVDEQGKKQALAALDERYEQLRKEKVEALTKELRQKHFDEQVQLKQEQLQEIAAAYKELAPQEVQQEFGQAEAKRLAESMQTFIAGLKEDSELDQNDLDASTAEALRLAEEERKAQAVKEEQELSRKLEERKQQMLAEQERKKASLLAGSDLDAAQREQIMMQFEADKRRIESAIEKERKRQHKRLQKLLDARNARAAKQAKKLQGANDTSAGDAKSTEQLMKDIFDNSGEAGATGLSDIKAATKTATSDNKNSEAAAAKEVAGATSEEELARIEEKYRAQMKSQDAQIKAEAARRKKQLEERRAKAKKDRERLKELKERAAKETDATKKKLLQDQADALARDLQSDEERLKEIESEFRKSEETQNAALLAQKKRHREKLKQRREQLKKEKEGKKAKDADSTQADAAASNTPEAQSKTLLGRLNDVEQAIRDLLDRKMTFNLAGANGSSVDRDGLPSALADKSDVLSRLDDLQNAVDQESDDEDARSEAGFDDDADDEIELLEVAPMHESKEAAANLEEEVEARKKGLAQLKAALAAETDPAKRAALEAAIADEEEKLRQIAAAYEKAQAEHEKSVEAQQQSAKEKLRKRREALRAKQEAARKARLEAKEAIGLKSAEVESLNAVIAEELDPVRKQELEKELQAAQASLRDTETNAAKAIASADDDAARAADALKAIEDEYERSIDQHAKNMESEAAAKKAQLLARKKARQEARAQKKAAAATAAAAAAERDAAAANVASLQAEAEAETDSDRKRELEQKLESETRNLAELEKAAAEAAEREALEAEKAHQIEQDFNDANAKYEESMRTKREQQKEKLRLRRERAKQLREQKLAAQQAVHDAQLLGAGAASDAVREELLRAAQQHLETLGSLDDELQSVEQKLNVATADVEASEQAQLAQLVKDRAATEAALEKRRENIRQGQRALFEEEDRVAALEKQLSGAKDPAKRAEILKALESQRAKVTEHEQALQDEEYALHQDLAALREHSAQAKEQQKEQLRLARERKRGLHSEIDQSTQQQIQQNTALEELLAAAEALETDALLQENDVDGEKLLSELAIAQAGGDDAKVSDVNAKLAAHRQQLNAKRAEALAAAATENKKRKGLLDALESSATGLANWMRREDAAMDDLQEKIIVETSAKRRQELFKELNGQRAAFSAEQKKQHKAVAGAETAVSKAIAAHAASVMKSNANRVKKLEQRRARAKEMHSAYQALAEKARSSGDKGAGDLEAKAKAQKTQMDALDAKLAGLEVIHDKVEQLLGHQQAPRDGAAGAETTRKAKTDELVKIVGGATGDAAAQAATKRDDAEAENAAEQVRMAEEQKARLQARLDKEREKVDELAKTLADTEDEAQAALLKKELEDREARLKGIQEQYNTTQAERKRREDEEAAMRKEKLRKRREAAKAKKAEIARLRAAGGDAQAEEEALADLHRDVEQLEKEEGALLEASEKARSEFAASLAAAASASGGASDVEKMKTLQNTIANKRAKMAELAATAAAADSSDEQRQKAAAQLAKLAENVALDEARLAAMTAAYNRAQEAELKAANERRIQRANKLKALKDKAKQKHEVVAEEKEALQRLLDDLASAPDEKTKKAIEVQIANKREDIARAEKEAQAADEEYEIALHEQEKDIASEKDGAAQVVAEKQNLLKQHQLEFQKERQAIEEENKRAAKELEALKMQAAKASDDQRKEIERQRAAIENKVAMKKEAMAARENELRFIKDEFEKANQQHSELMAAEEAKRKEKLKARREAMKAKRKKLLSEKAELNAKKNASDSLALNENQLVERIAKLEKAIPNAEGADKTNKQAQLVQLKDQLAKIRADRARLQDELEQNQARVQATSTELEANQEELASAVTKVKSDSKAMSAARRDDIRSKQRDIRNLEKLIKQKSAARDKARADGDSNAEKELTATIDDLNSQVALLGHQLQALKFDEDMEKMDLAIIALENANDELYQKVQSKEASLDERQKALVVKRQQVEALQVDLAAAATAAEKATIEKETESLERMIEAETKAVDAEITQVKVQVDSYQKKIDAEFKKRQDYVKRYRDSVSTKKQFLEGFNPKIANAETALARAEAQGADAGELTKLEAGLAKLRATETKLQRTLETTEEKLALAEEDVQDKSKAREEMKQVLLQRERESIRLQKAQKEARRARMQQLEAEAARATSELEKKALEKKLQAEKELQAANDAKLKAEESLLQAQLQQNQNKLRDIEQQFNERRERENAVVNAEKEARKEKLRARREAMKKKKAAAKAAGGGGRSGGASAADSAEVAAKIAELEEKTAELEARENAVAAKQQDLLERERKLAALEKKLAAKKKMMALEKSMKAKQMDKRKEEISKKEEELKEVQARNRAEANRLDSLEKQRQKEHERLEKQREDLKNLENALANETDDGKKRRMTVQMKKFARNFQSAERKVKRMEEEYQRSLEEHTKKMKAEELRRKDKLRQRREQLKSRRARAAKNRPASAATGGGAKPAPKAAASASASPAPAAAASASAADPEDQPVRKAPPPPKKRAPPPPRKESSANDDPDAMPQIEED